MQPRDRDSLCIAKYPVHLGDPGLLPRLGHDSHPQVALQELPRQGQAGEDAETRQGLQGEDAQGRRQRQGERLGLKWPSADPPLGSPANRWHPRHLQRERAQPEVPEEQRIRLYERHPADDELPVQPELRPGLRHNGLDAAGRGCELQELDVEDEQVREADDDRVNHLPVFDLVQGRASQQEGAQLRLREDSDEPLQ